MSDFDVTGGLQELATLLVADETLDTTLARVVAVGLRCHPEVAGAAVILGDPGGARPLAASNEVAAKILEQQIAVGEGPGIDALKGTDPIVVDSVADDDRWPRFSEAVAPLSVKSVLALPLRARGETVGALSLYSYEPDAFDDAARAELAPFAAQAAVALTNARTYDDCSRLVGQLQEALDSRVVIEQAKGVLMERERVDADGAFELLKKMSQNSNHKLREVAQRVVDSSARKSPG